MYAPCSSGIPGNQFSMDGHTVHTAALRTEKGNPGEGSFAKAQTKIYVQCC